MFQPPLDKDAARHAANCAGRFVILSDASNHRRKLLPRLMDIVLMDIVLMDIVRMFAKTNDNVTLLLNTNPPGKKIRMSIPTT